MSARAGTAAGAAAGPSAETGQREQGAPTLCDGTLGAEAGDLARGVALAGIGIAADAGLRGGTAAALSTLSTVESTEAEPRTGPRLGAGGRVAALFTSRWGGRPRRRQTPCPGRPRTRACHRALWRTEANTHSACRQRGAGQKTLDLYAKFRSIQSPGAEFCLLANLGRHTLGFTRARRQRAHDGGEVVSTTVMPSTRGAASEAQDGGEVQHVGEGPPAAVAGAEGESRLRPRSSRVSYKEPSLIGRPESPPPPRVRPPRVGDTIEVEVASSGGETSWKPAEVVVLLRNGRFRACVNEESDFIEEYTQEDAGTEWRWPSRGSKRQRRAVDFYQPAVEQHPAAARKGSAAPRPSAPSTRRVAAPSTAGA